MDSTRTCSERQQADDQDYPISRAFFPDHLWHRPAPRRRPDGQHRPVSPLGRDQELDGTRQELMGWRSRALNLEGQLAKAQREIEALHEAIRRKAAPAAFRGVQDDHVGG